MKEKKWIVNGFSFENQEEYQEAEKEAKNIIYLMENTDLQDRNTILKLYEKLVAKNMFHTIIGLSFLKELQNKLIDQKQLTKETCIPIPDYNKHRNIKGTFHKENHKTEQAIEKYKNIIKKQRIVLVGLAAVILIMLGISLTRDRDLVSKKALINQYASWKEELEKKEVSLREWEKELREKEEHQNP